MRSFISRLPRVFSRSMYNDFNSELLLQKSITHKINHHDSGVNENSLRCTVFNKKGRLSGISADISKRDLVMRYKLMPRDIRKFNYKSTNIVPYLSVRNDSILLNLLGVRALIKNDSVILFEGQGNVDSRTRSLLMGELLNKLQHHEDDLPYEMRALEGILMSVVASMNQELKMHKHVVKGILNDLETHIDTENLKLLLGQSKKFGQFYQKAKLIHQVIDEILDQDDVLSQMYLTNPRTDIHDHTEVEILLEVYLKHFDEIVQIAEEQINNIKTTEEIINIILDSNRNQLMVLGLKFSIGILFLGSAIYVASVYGMNLENFFEQNDYGFAVVVGITTFVMAVLFFKTVFRLQKLEKIAMSGNKSMPSGRHNH